MAVVGRMNVLPLFTGVGMGVIEPQSGVWWTEHNPTRRVPGTLTRSDDSWQLDLVGTLEFQDTSQDTRQDAGIALIPLISIFGACLGVRYTVVGCRVTLSRKPGWPRHTDDEGDDQYSQTWVGQSLLRGAALPEEVRYSAARFEFTGLDRWWKAGGLKGEKPAEQYSPPEPGLVNCGDGLTISIWTDIEETNGSRRRSVTEKVYVTAALERGFTFDFLIVHVILPIRALLSIVLHEHVEDMNCLLYRFGEPEYLPIVVDPGVERAAISYLRGTFPGNQESIENLVPRWLRLAWAFPLPVAVADPRARGGPAQTQAVEAVNAAEALHRGLHAEASSSDFAEKVKEALAGTRLNSRERRKIYDAITLGEPSLEGRLYELATELGTEFCDWFFTGQVSNWAFVSSVVRNALAHGYPTRHGLENESATLVAIISVVSALLRIRLLVAAGLSTAPPFVRIIQADPNYRAVARQTLADWDELAARVDPNRKAAPSN